MSVMPHEEPVKKPNGSPVQIIHLDNEFVDREAVKRLTKNLTGYQLHSVKNRRAALEKISELQGEHAGRIIIVSDHELDEADETGVGFYEKLQMHSSFNVIPFALLTGSKGKAEEELAAKPHLEPPPIFEKGIDLSQPFMEAVRHLVGKLSPA